jgi:hypothetical protein
MVWRQGTGEWWLGHIWWPYWKKLSRHERIEYLEKWDAPEDWREYIQRCQENQIGEADDAGVTP